MTKYEKERITQILKQILDVEDYEIKDCAIETLIEMINEFPEKGINEETYRERGP